MKTLSFSYDVKNELCASPLEGDDARRAEIYGLLLFGRMFGPGAFALQTEHEGVYQTADTLLRSLYGITAGVQRAEKCDGRVSLTLFCDLPKEAGALFSSFGYSERTVSLRVNRANLEDEPAAAAFLRGAFLSCGTVVDPTKGYHLEFVTPFLNLSRDLAGLLSEYGFGPKSTFRKGNHVVYFKESGQIEDLLTFMGATRQSLELMNTKVYKDLRNKANRVTNCETANIEKTVNASTLQVEAIHRLLRHGGMEKLPEDLREIAELRLQYPEVSLRELGALLGTPLSRSGVNHRLMKLLELASRCPSF